MERRCATFRRPAARAAPLPGLALALALAACTGDRPRPLEDHVWIQTSTDHVVFRQAAFAPASIDPASAVVRLVYAGAPAPATEPLVGVTGEEGAWLTAVLHADASGWGVALQPGGTEAFGPGTYTKTLQVRWDGATNSPVSVEVTLIVGPHPGLWQPGQPSVARRLLHTTTALNDGGAVAIGGRFSEAEIERLDPVTGRWSAAGTLLAGRWQHTATLLEDGTVLVAGGISYSGERPGGTWEIYDPAAGAVTARGSLCVERYGHAAVRLRDGRVLLVGGADFSSEPEEGRTAEIFDPWRRTAECVGGLHGNASLPTPAALLPDGRVLVTNQTPEGIEAGAEVFDPATNRWTTAASRPSARVSHALVTLADGRVALVAGSLTDPWASLATELYDPSTGEWSIAAVPRALHLEARDAAVLLPSGRVLVAGGAASATGSVAEVFDPAQGSWSIVGALGSPRELHTVTLLGDGRLVAVGGWPLQDRPEFWSEGVTP